MALAESKPTNPMMEDEAALSPISTSYDSENSEDRASVSYDSTNPEKLTQADIERLGRQRPALFSTLFVEVSFITVIVVSLMMSEYYTSGFNILVPKLTVVIDIPESIRTWPTAVPNLAAAAFLLPFSRLCSLYGARLVFLGGHVWLFVWSVAIGFCKNSIMIIVCRAMQGVGFAAFLPAGMALFGQLYRPGPRKNLVYSIYGAFACVGFYFGIFMAAMTAQFLDWRWYFWVGAVIEFAVLAVGFFAIPSRLNDRDALARMDWWGLCTIVPGLALVIFAFTDAGHASNGWKTPYIAVTLTLGCLFLVAAGVTQGWVSAQPLLPPRLFKPLYMKRLLAGLLCYYGIFSIFLFYTSFYIEDILHASTLQAAAWYTPLLVGGLILAIGGGLVLHIVSCRVLMLIANVGFLLSVMLFAVIPDTSSSSGKHHSTSFVYWAYIFPAMCAATIGVDLTFNVTNVFITTALPKRDQAIAGGLTNSLIYLGSSLWLSMSDVAITTTQNHQHKDLSLLQQYRIGFWMGVALAIVGFGLTFSVKIGSASAELTADEKEIMERHAEQNLTG